MSTYRVRPNKTNRVWPPVKDTDTSKDSEEPSASMTQAKDPPKTPGSTEGRKKSWQSNDWRSKDDKTEIPSKSILRPVKPREKDLEQPPTKTNNVDIPPKSSLRPIKTKETPPAPPKEKFVKPVLRPVKSKEPEVPPPETPKTPDCEWKREAFRRQNRWSQRSVDAVADPTSKEELFNTKRNSISAKGSNKMDENSQNGPPAPPPPPPPPPPGSVPNAPPPPPGMAQPVKKRPGNQKLLEEIKKASRTRPDWKNLMKDLEGGIKLKHVKSEDKLDRSSPILASQRGKEGAFLYESETPDKKQSELLNEIHRGVKLKKVKTNDRSRPDFQKLGIRKLRRQMTKEEKKTIPADAPEALPSSSDDEEDIDRMRDDLKATKLQLAEEIKKTKQMEREAKIQNIDLESLRADVKKLKRQLKEAGVQDVKPIRNCEAADMAPKLSKSMSKLRMREEEMDFSELDVIDEEIKTLEDQIDAQRKRAEKAEQKCEELISKMKVVQNASDEWELRSIYFEKKFKTFQKDQGIELPDIRCFGTQTDPVEVVSESEKTPRDFILSRKSQSRKSFGAVPHMESFQEEESEEDSSEETSETESEEETETESEVEAEPRKRGEQNESKRKERDVKMWISKVTASKERIRIARKERNLLREKILKHYSNMRVERKEYLRVKEELNELVGPTEENEQNSDESDSDDERPKPAGRRKSSKSVDNGEIDSSDEDLEDMSKLQDPSWDESETDQESSDDNEEEDDNTRIRRLQDKHQKCENKYNSLKKESHVLKTQNTRCDELYNEEKRRHQRLDNELQMLLTCLE